MPAPGTPTIHWVRYDPRRVLLEVSTLSPAADAAHRLLCDHYWAAGRPLRYDPPSLARAARIDPADWPGVAAELLAAGWRETPAGWSCPAAQAVLTEARQTLRRKSSSGRLGAQRRWGETAPNEPAHCLPEPGRDAFHRVPIQRPSHGRGGTRPYQANEVHGEGAGLDGRPAATGTSSARAADPPPADAAAMAPPSLRHGSATVPPSTVNSKTVRHKPNSTKTRTNAERSSLTASTRKASGEEEERFLADVLQAMSQFSPSVGQEEISQWGGCWRNRFREAPAKARRILAEIRCMVRERRIHSNPGAAANDLWQRLP